MQDTGYLGNYALIPDFDSPRPSHTRAKKICFKTQVAIRAELLSANEWEYFALNGEDMGVDQSEQVESWLKPLFKDFRREALASIKELKSREKQGAAVKLALGRWLEIRDALDDESLKNVKW